MDLKDLMVISGYPGVYRFISQGRNAIIVESLEDKKRMSAYSTSRISTLEEISVFTGSGEMSLADVFKRMYEHSGGAAVIGHKSSSEEIKKFFAEVLPEYDRDRVYVSDMKKIINWYNLLLDYGMLKPAPEDKGDPDSGSGEKGSTGSGTDGTGSAGPDSDEPLPDGPAAGNETGTISPGKEGTDTDKAGGKEPGSEPDGQ
jgi:hypothetical protein